MKIRIGFWLPVLLVTAALNLASCGGSAGGGMDGMGGEEGGPQQGRPEKAAGKTGGGMEGMDMGGQTGAAGMVEEDGEYSDRAFRIGPS